MLAHHILYSIPLFRAMWREPDEIPTRIKCGSFLPPDKAPKLIGFSDLLFYTMVFFSSLQARGRKTLAL